MIRQFGKMPEAVKCPVCAGEFVAMSGWSEGVVHFVCNCGSAFVHQYIRRGNVVTFHVELVSASSEPLA